MSCIIFLSSTTTTSLILIPLLAIALRASLFEDNISFSAIKFKIFIPFSTKLYLIFISGKPEPRPPCLNVSLAVFSALPAAYLP